MPLFEYRCAACAKQFTWMSGVVADERALECPRCASHELKKLISRVGRGRSDDARMEELADRLDAQNFDDPRTMRRFAREMGREMGAETGEDLSEEMEALAESEALENGAGASGGSDDTIY